MRGRSNAASVRIFMFEVTIQNSFDFLSAEYAGLFAKSAATTRQPSFASFRQIAVPKPPTPPETTATRLPIGCLPLSVFARGSAAPGAGLVLRLG